MAVEDTTFRVIDWAITGAGALMSIIGAMLGMRITKVEKATDDITREHQKLEVRIAGEYTPRRELEKLGEALFSKLDTIEKLLHQKADK